MDGSKTPQGIVEAYNYVAGKSSDQAFCEMPHNWYIYEMTKIYHGEYIYVVIS